MATSASLSLGVGGTAEDEDMISDTGHDFHDELHDEPFQIHEDQDMLEEASSQLGYERGGAQAYSRDDEFMQESPTIQFSELPEASASVVDGEAPGAAATYDDQSELYDWEDEIDYTSLERPVYESGANTSSNPTLNQTSIDQSEADTPTQESATYENAPPQSHDREDDSTEQETDASEQYHAPVDSTQAHLDPPNETGHEDAWLSPAGARSPPSASSPGPDSGVVANQPTAHDKSQNSPAAEDRQPPNPSVGEANDNVAAVEGQYQAEDSYGVGQENPYAFDPFFDALPGHHHLHPHLVPTIIVNYEHEQFPLFPPIKGYPELEEFEDWGPLLNDTQLAYKPILDLFSEIRRTLGDIDPEYELVLKFPDLNNLEVREVSDRISLLSAAFGQLFTGTQNDHRFSPQSTSGYDFYSMHVISSIFQRMHHNDGSTELHPLFVDLSARAVPRHPGLMLKAFFDAARAGFGFSFGGQAFFGAISDSNIPGTEQDDSRESEPNSNNAEQQHNQEAALTDTEHLVSVEPKYNDGEPEEEFGEFDHADAEGSYYAPETDNTTGETLVDNDAQGGEFESNIEEEVDVNNTAGDLLDAARDEKVSDEQPGDALVEASIYDSNKYIEVDGGQFDDNSNSAAVFSEIAGDSSPETLLIASSTLHGGSHVESQSEYSSDNSCADWLMLDTDLDAVFDFTQAEEDPEDGSFDDKLGQELEGNDVSTHSERPTQNASADESVFTTTELDEIPEETNAAALAKADKSEFDSETQAGTEHKIDQEGVVAAGSSVTEAHLSAGDGQNDEKDGPIQTGLGPEGDYELTWGEERDGPVLADSHTFEPSTWTKALAELRELGSIAWSDPFIDTNQEADAVASTVLDATSPGTTTTPNKLKRRRSDVEHNPDDNDENEKKRLRKTPEAELDEIV